MRLLYISGLLFPLAHSLALVVASCVGNDLFGFKLRVIQADTALSLAGGLARIKSGGRIAHHTRPHHPNDNAHIERFNRTIQDECIGKYWNLRDTVELFNKRIAKYYIYNIDRYIDLYNNHRLHSSIEYKTPRKCYLECCIDNEPICYLYGVLFNRGLLQT